MSFTSDYSVLLDVDLETCYAAINPDTFVDFMLHAPITKSIEITNQDMVDVDDELNIIENETGVCKRLHFHLIEEIVYLGITKEIDVIGSIVFHDSENLHIDHRVASGGLVTTHNIRRFSAQEGKTRIDETLLGSAAWYLRIFTESQARTSHRGFMDAYATFLKREGYK